MSWTHLSDTTPKARKKYRCYLCGLKIDPGEVHVKRTGVQDGELCETRMHSLCESKTKGWDEYEWMSHDPSEFRDYELGHAPEHSN